MEFWGEELPYTGTFALEGFRVGVEGLGSMVHAWRYSVARV